MVNAGKELRKIAGQNIFVATGELLSAVESAMRAFADTVGIRIENKRTFQWWLDQIAQGVVNHAVTERRGGNEAAFRFVDIKTGIGSGGIGFGFKLVLERQEVVFEMIL